MSIKTFKQIRDFNITSDSFLNKKPENVQTKLGYAITKLRQGQIDKVLKEYQTDHAEKFYDMVQRKQVDLALVDKNTQAVLASTPGSIRPYLYDKEGLNSIMKIELDFNVFWDKQLEEWDKKEFNIEPHYSVQIPEDLTEIEKESFQGFVIE